jgi:hypothetical protein
MGIREDQVCGLQDRARSLLEVNKMELCSHCGQELPASNEIPGKYTWYGMFDDLYELKGFRLKDGSPVYEQKQEVIWSSGPMLFTALEDENGQWIEDSLWSTEEMQSYV